MTMTTCGALNAKSTSSGGGEADLAPISGQADTAPVSGEGNSPVDSFGCLTIPVSDGQVIELECDDDCEIEEGDDGENRK